MPALAFFPKVTLFTGIKGTFITFPMIKRKQNVLLESEESCTVWLREGRIYGVRGHSAVLCSSLKQVLQHFITLARPVKFSL